MIVQWVITCMMPGCSEQTKPPTNIDASYRDSVLLQPFLQSINDSIHFQPSNANLYFRRAGLLYANQAYQMAAEDLQMAIRLSPGNFRYRVALGDVMMALQNWDEATQYYRAALQLRPQQPEAALKLAEVLFEKKAYRKTGELLTTVLQVHPRIPEAHYLQSRLGLINKDTIASIQELKKAVACNPHYYQALVDLGDLLSYQKNDLALQYYDRAYAMDSSQPYPVYGKAVLMKALHRYDRAIQWYRQCITIDPNFSDAYLDLGDLYLEQSNYQQAFRYFDTCTKVDRTNAYAYYGRGRCNEQLGRLQMAIQDYYQALAFDKNLNEAKLALQRLGKKT